jgi:hypothetical protein
MAVLERDHRDLGPFTVNRGGVLSAIGCQPSAVPLNDLLKADG